MIPSFTLINCQHVCIYDKYKANYHEMILKYTLQMC